MTNLPVSSGIRQKMDDLITFEEIETSRTPSDFIRWFEAYLEKTRVDRRYRRKILLREGIAKVVYEEVFPLYRMLQVFGDDWIDLRFKNVIGDQNFDVDVAGDAERPFRYIEITIADLSYEERLRMQYYIEAGSVPAIGKVSHSGTKNKGHTIKVSDDARLHTEVNREKQEGILKAIARKTEKDYPKDSVLLVYFDDYIAFADEDDETEMESFIENLNDDWESKFTEIFIVGASGRRAWRKLRANQTLHTIVTLRAPLV